MGHSKARKCKSGTRWTAYYDSYDGRVRSAGTFATKEAADLAWLSRESAIGKGAVDDPDKARMTFKDFADNVFLPNHVVSPARGSGPNVVGNIPKWSAGEVPIHSADQPVVRQDVVAITCAR